MTHQPATFHAPGLTDAGAEIARLREVQALVREIGGEQSIGGSTALDEAARISSAYASALPIVQRRFDEETGIVARWAAGTLQPVERPVPSVSPNEVLIRVRACGGAGSHDAPSRPIQTFRVSPGPIHAGPRSWA